MDVQELLHFSNLALLSASSFKLALRFIIFFFLRVPVESRLSLKPACLCLRIKDMSVLDDLFEAESIHDTKFGFLKATERKFRSTQGIVTEMLLSIEWLGVDLRLQYVNRELQHLLPVHFIILQ